MATRCGQFTGAAEQVKADAAGRMEVGWDWALPGGVARAGRTRRTQGLGLALVLVCLLALPLLAPAEAIALAVQMAPLGQRDEL